MLKYKMREKTLIKRFSLEEKVLNQFCPCTIRGFRYPCYSLPWYIYIPNIPDINQTNINIINQALFAANTWVPGVNFYFEFLFDYNIFLSWIKIMIIGFLYSNFFWYYFTETTKWLVNLSMIINWAVSFPWHVLLDPLEKFGSKLFLLGNGPLKIS